MSARIRATGPDSVAPIARATERLGAAPRVPSDPTLQPGIEHFTTRHRSLIQGILRLRYGMRVAQLERILERMCALLVESPRIEKGTHRIRLVSFCAETAAPKSHRIHARRAKWRHSSQGKAAPEEGAFLHRTE